jgi:hypothetical protein
MPFVRVSHPSRRLNVILSPGLQITGWTPSVHQHGSVPWPVVTKNPGSLILVVDLNITLMI